MPDLLPAAEALAEKRCLVTLHNQPDFVLLQPIKRTKRTKHEAEADDPCRGDGRQAPE